MFSRKKPEEKPPREKKPRGNLPLLGYEVPEDDGGDADLERELSALMGGGGKKVKQGRGKEVSSSQLNAMVADCMKDFDDDEDMSDTEDPELLAELEGFDSQDSEDDSQASRSELGVSHSFTQTIRERLALYREAEAIALSNGDSGRARRFNRGVKTLVELERKAVAGGGIREDDIPPVISVGRRVQQTSDNSSSSQSPVSPEAPPPSRPAPEPRPTPPTRQAPAEHPPPPTQPAPEPRPPATVSAAQQQVSLINSQISELEAARGRYKKEALAAKTAGDRQTAIEMVRGIKTCENLLEEIRQGNVVDLSVIRQTQAPVIATPVVAPVVASSHADAEQTVETSEGAPAAPLTILESLTERMEKYRQEEARAKEAGNESKARRMGRVKKQYEEAIKLHKAGRPFPRADLPDTPGFAPIPLGDPAPARQVRQAPVPTASQAPAPSTSQSPPQAAPAKKGPSLGRQTSVMSVQDKQLAGLTKRQELFKAAALQAKQQGQTDTAREYLRQALSFNKLIEVSKAGLPVDMGTLPVPPQMQVKTDMDFEIVSKEECSVTGDREEMYSKLEQDLIGQVKMCMNNRTYFKEVGDVASSNKFEQMALHSKKDLDAVRNSFKRGDPVPKFHYETRAFSRVVSNTELTDNDLELSVLNGINYVVKNPKEVDTYIKWEFPFPRDAPTVDKTAVVKDTNNPEYNSVHMITINPRDKTFQRVVKRGAVKLEVWAKGGFLRSDTLIGTANVKLAPLETSCTIHDSFDLYEGRKSVGGKVEAKIKIRNGILAKQIEQVKEKWLVIQF